MIHQLLYARPVTRDKVFGIDWASISFWLNHEEHAAGRMMKTATDMKPQSCIFGREVWFFVPSVKCANRHE